MSRSGPNPGQGEEFAVLAFRFAESRESRQAALTSVSCGRGAQFPRQMQATRTSNVQPENLSLVSDVSFTVLLPGLVAVSP